MTGLLKKPIGPIRWMQNAASGVCRRSGLWDAGRTYVICWKKRWPLIRLRPEYMLIWLIVTASREMSGKLPDFMPMRCVWLRKWTICAGVMCRACFPWKTMHRSGRPVMTGFPMTRFRQKPIVFWGRASKRLTVWFLPF